MNMQYEKKRSISDFNNGKKIVEVQGYVSAQKQIESLIYSGRQLALTRMSDFDFKEGEDLVADPGMDLRNEDDLVEGLEIIKGFDPKPIVKPAVKPEGSPKVEDPKPIDKVIDE